MYDTKPFVKQMWLIGLFSALVLLVCASVAVFLPEERGVLLSDTGVAAEPAVVAVQDEPVAQEQAALPESSEEGVFSADSDLAAQVESAMNSRQPDMGLTLYRQEGSRDAVLWYYSQITKDHDVAKAILDAADEFDVPLSLAFALAYTESGFDARAEHTNANGSIDRGLFQLNNNSFPRLTEEEFFNPEISAYYGMSHLQFCLQSAGNEIAALAMYNAGSNKVRKNNTPQRTLNYISRIESYRNSVEDTFAGEVLAYYRMKPAENLLARK